jgi:hypothetical protein
VARRQQPGVTMAARQLGAPGSRRSPRRVSCAAGRVLPRQLRDSDREQDVGPLGGRPLTHLAEKAHRVRVWLSVLSPHPCSAAMRPRLPGLPAGLAWLTVAQWLTWRSRLRRVGQLPEQLRSPERGLDRHPRRGRLVRLVSSYRQHHTTSAPGTPLSISYSATLQPGPPRPTRSRDRPFLGRVPTDAERLTEPHRRDYLLAQRSPDGVTAAKSVAATAAGYFTATSSAMRMFGSPARRSGATWPRAWGIGPARCASRASSVSKVSKMP